MRPGFQLCPANGRTRFRHSAAFLLLAQFPWRETCTHSLEGIKSVLLCNLNDELMLRIKQSLKVGPYLPGCIWPVPGILIFSGMMGAVPDLNPPNKMSQYVIFSIKVSTITKQFENTCRIWKDLGVGQGGIFQRNFKCFLMYFFSGLNLSVGSAPCSVISRSLQQ